MAPDLPPFAVAQAVVRRGDIAANIGSQLRLAVLAADAGARLVLFPELALSGYEPALAADLALQPDDARLAPLRSAAIERDIAIVTGAPLRAAGKPPIAALSFLPDGSVHVYTKQYLHPGEDAAFAAGTGGASLPFGAGHVALAVCAEIAHAAHAAAAAAGGAALYGASVLVSEQGYAADAGLLEQYARTHGMPVAMANHGGPTGGWVSAGRSAVWDETGRLVVAAAGAGECLLLAQRRAGVWQGSVLPV